MSKKIQITVAALAIVGMFAVLPYAYGGSYTITTSAGVDAALQGAMDSLNTAAVTAGTPAPYADLPAFVKDVCKQAFVAKADWIAAQHPTAFCDKWLAASQGQRDAICTSAAMGLSAGCNACEVLSNGTKVGGGTIARTPVNQ